MYAQVNATAKVHVCVEYSSPEFHTLICDIV